MDIFPGMISRWPAGTQKGAQHHWIWRGWLGLWWGVTSHLLEQLSSLGAWEMAKAGGDVGQALCTVGGNVGCCTHYRGLYGELGIGLPCVKWLTSGCMSEWNRTTIPRGCLHPHVHCSVVYGAQDTEAAWASIGRWMSGKDAECVGGGILFS